MSGASSRQWEEGRATSVIRSRAIIGADQRWKLEIMEGILRIIQSSVRGHLQWEHCSKNAQFWLKITYFTLKKGGKSRCNSNRNRQWKSADTTSSISFSLCLTLLDPPTISPIPSPRCPHPSPSMSSGECGGDTWRAAAEATPSYQVDEMGREWVQSAPEQAHYIITRPKKQNIRFEKLPRHNVKKSNQKSCWSRTNATRMDNVTV